MIDFKAYTSKRNAEGQHTLPGHYYTSAETYEKELETIFYRRWICAGRSSQLAKPGDFITQQIGRESILITRNADGSAKGFYNLCRHRGTRICAEQSGHFADRIQCPYHAWTYDLNGKLIGAPNMNEVPTFQAEKFPLHPVHV